MFKWFKKKGKQQEEKQTAVTKDSGEAKKVRGLIKYNVALIDSLISEHRELLQIYTAIIASLKNADYAKVAEKLTDFALLLRAHLLKEHMELYVYLEYILASDRITFEYMHEIRLEMDHISSNVMGFLHSYQDRQITAEMAPEFQQRLEKIGKVLVARIKREEQSLYTLYKAPA
ncbi:MAG: hemerythrin domain-containing protein [Gammaproteobacteria bacterium]|nr:hemerythrin domain-containing protein [Gammaproteobacteria bacterium]